MKRKKGQKIRKKRAKRKKNAIKMKKKNKKMTCRPIIRLCNVLFIQEIDRRASLIFRPLFAPGIQEVGEGANVRPDGS